MDSLKKDRIKSELEYDAYTYLIKKLTTLTDKLLSNPAKMREAVIKGYEETKTSALIKPIINELLKQNIPTMGIIDHEGNGYVSSFEYYYARQVFNSKEVCLETEIYNQLTPEDKEYINIIAVKAAGHVKE